VRCGLQSIGGCRQCKREGVRQLGNAVTPPVAEILIAALVGAIAGEPTERAA
jgi:DNA (cytosine-5)-methyltransferase 1